MQFVLLLTKNDDSILIKLVFCGEIWVIRLTNFSLMGYYNRILRTERACVCIWETLRPLMFKEGIYFNSVVGLFCILSLLLLLLLIIIISFLDSSS